MYNHFKCSLLETIILKTLLFFIAMLALRRLYRSAPKYVRQMSGLIAVDDKLNGLTDDQMQLRESVMNFAQAELAPYAEEMDRTNTFNNLREFWIKCGDMGLHGVTCPEEYGGKLSFGNIYYMTYMGYMVDLDVYNLNKLNSFYFMFNF